MASVRPDSASRSSVASEQAVAFDGAHGGDSSTPNLRLPPIIQTFNFWREPLRFLDLCHIRYGDRFIVRPVGTPPFVFFADPVEIKSIIAAPADVLHPGAGAAVITPLVGETSFMLQEGNQHMNMRKAILPALHRDAIKSHAEFVSSIADREIARWPLNTSFSIHPYLCALTLKVVLMMIFGEWDDSLRALHRRLFAMQNATPTLALQEPVLRRFPGWHGTWNNFLGLRTEVEMLLQAAVDRRHSGRHDPGDVLTMLLAANNIDGSPLSSRQLCDNIITTIISGHETTASELAWTFQLLAHHPDVRRKLTNEIDTGGPSNYLTATMCEVLRHRPVFPFAIPRAVKQPIEVGHQTYRPPMHLLACIYLVHHHPALHPHPHEFRPERFLEESPQPHLWLPWGGGRKRCPGRHLAILEMQIVLRATLSRLEVMPAARKIERARWRSVIVTPHAGSRVILRTRSRTGQ